jgi:hypothetical protein
MCEASHIDCETLSARRHDRCTRTPVPEVLNYAERGRLISRLTCATANPLNPLGTVRGDYPRRDGSRLRLTARRSR